MAGAQSALVTAWYRGSWWLVFLRPLEFLFRAIAALRRGLFHWGFKTVYRSPIPVVVVGNITVGGTGKTPVVIALVEYLQARGIKPGVVSRGYGSTAGVYPHTVTEHSRASECGDEPLLIYRRTHCPCVVAPDRVQAVKQLQDNFQVDIVLSDDGLQHYALARDLEIAVLDEQRKVGNGYCLPAGPLREPVARLRQIDHVLMRGSDDALKGVSYSVEALVNVHSGEESDVSPGKLGNSVYAVAGIGQPSQFFAMLTERGFSLETSVFADHHIFSPGDFSRLQGKAIIMTEKDAVKCREFAGANAWYLKITARLPEAVNSAVLALANPDKPVD